MTSHELAKILLEMPNLLVQVPRMDIIHSIEKVTKAEVNTVDKAVAEFIPTEEIRTIIISGSSTPEIWEKKLNKS
ncbi:MAG: hypothetical protein WC716_16225 [Chitinophagaceae bacterium]|jgi:hypothetical protein